MDTPKANMEGAKNLLEEGVKGLETAIDSSEQANILSNYLKYNKQESLSDDEKKEMQEFETKVEEWGLQGDVESLRTGGITKEENTKDPNKKHILLSSAFLKQESELKFEVNFKENETAYWKVGAGDIFPPAVNKIRVTRQNGEVFEGERGIHPATKRVGYYTKEGDYIPVFTGDKIEILETLKNANQIKWREGQESIGIYDNGGAKDDASLGAERLYDPASGRTFESESDRDNFDKDNVRQDTRSRLGELSSELPSEIQGPISSKTREVNGIKFPDYNRTQWQELCGDNEVKAERWIVRKDPITGGPITFMGEKIQGGINMTMLPFLKEAEEKIEQIRNRLNYKFKDISSFNFRKIRGGGALSMHSWGVAIDLNPGTNAMGKQGDMPQEVVDLFESLGFVWGGRWKGKNIDPMHFELRIDPFMGKNLLKGRGLQYWNALEPKMKQVAGPNRVKKKESVASSASQVPSSKVSNRPTSKIEGIWKDHKNNENNMRLEANRYGKEFKFFRDRAIKNKRRYEKVAEKTGMPWKLIASLHYRESSMNFNTYLHNGQPLGKVTTKVPKGILFHDWESASIHALNSKQSVSRQLGINKNTSSMAPLLTYAETYNGLAYRLKNAVSPYVYAGTNIYKGGLIQRDGGAINKNAYDKRLGVAACLMALKDV